MNSESTNLYSISDLAEQVGVPRTTITDWLGKYSRFIELQTQGRRRFYTERTLAAGTRAAEGLVRGGGDHVAVRHRVLVQAGGHEAGDVRHVH